jgi:hypothetical protein
MSSGQKNFGTLGGRRSTTHQTTQIAKAAPRTACPAVMEIIDVRK